MARDMVIKIKNKWYEVSYCVPLKKRCPIEDTPLIMYYYNRGKNFIRKDKVEDVKYGQCATDILREHCIERESTGFVGACQRYLTENK